MTGDLGETCEDSNAEDLDWFECRAASSAQYGNFLNYGTGNLNTDTLPHGCLLDENCGCDYLFYNSDQSGLSTGSAQYKPVCRERYPPAPPTLPPPSPPPITPNIEAPTDDLEVGQCTESTRITDEFTCGRAASLMGFTYLHPPENVDNRPYGCYYDQLPPNGPDDTPPYIVRLNTDSASTTTCRRALSSASDPNDLKDVCLCNPEHPNPPSAPSPPVNPPPPSNSKRGLIMSDTMPANCYHHFGDETQWAYSYAHRIQSAEQLQFLNAYDVEFIPSVHGIMQHF